MNADVPTNVCPEVFLSIFPNEEYQDELDQWLKDPSPLLPVEYYTYEWRSFADNELTRRPRALSVATIDSRTVKSAAGVDYHLLQILSDHLESAEKAQISLDYRGVNACKAKPGNRCRQTGQVEAAGVGAMIRANVPSYRPKPKPPTSGIRARRDRLIRMIE